MHTPRDVIARAAEGWLVDGGVAGTLVSRIRYETLGDISKAVLACMVQLFAAGEFFPAAKKNCSMHK